MKSSTFKIKSYPDMWESPGMTAERFKKLRRVLEDVFQTTFADWKEAGQHFEKIGGQNGY